MPTRSPERVEFLNDVITTAVEGGINCWAAVSDYKWSGVPETTVTVHELDYDTSDFMESGVPVTVETIASAIGKIVRGESQISEDRVKMIKDASAENDAGDIDSDLADCIVQVAVLGDVVYG